MPKAYFVVRAVVEAPLRQKFDTWYSAHHLPMALAEFKVEKCWRFWSAAEAGVHYAVYQFAGMALLDAALAATATLNPFGETLTGTPVDLTWT